MVISKKTIFSKVSEGGGGGGGPAFSRRGGGSKCYTFLKKHIKYVIFQEAPVPLSNLWTRECILLP